MPCLFDHYDLENGPEFCKIMTPISRKSHKCIECGHDIMIGTKYERVTGKWDGDMDTIITCWVCAEIRRHLFLDNWTYGAMWDDLKECARDLELGDLDGLSLAAIGKLEHLFEGTSFQE